MRLPSMPRKNSDGDGWTSSITSRASNCSLRLRTKCGQCAVPGMSSCRLLIIWQPLQTPSAKESVAREECRELVARTRIEQDRLRPALAGAEHVAVGKSAASDDAREAIEARARPR